jgi:neurotransmitter-gated ion-channel
VLSSRFAMRRFPFDRQSLEVHFHPFFNDVTLETFSVDLKNSGISLEQRTYSSLAQWHVIGVSARAGSTRQFRSFAIPEAVFTVGVERRYSFYLWKVFLPLLLMVFLSWAVFWLEPNDVSNQVQIGVTTILTVIAFAFAISATMPRVSYLTYIDAFFLTCYVFVFIAIVELMTVHTAHRRRGPDVSSRIRRVSRWLVPAAFFAMNIVLIAAFLG